VTETEDVKSADWSAEWTLQGQCGMRWRGFGVAGTAWTVTFS
jgi:hypothetical protein